MMYEMYTPTNYSIEKTKAKMLQYTIDTFGGKKVAALKSETHTDGDRKFGISRYPPIRHDLHWCPRPRRESKLGFNHFWPVWQLLRGVEGGYQGWVSVQTRSDKSPCNWDSLV